jgi:predicted nucleic acid-binding protein
MSVEVFLDTNILLYAASGTPREATKREIARRILRDTDFGISVQVIQEFYVNATRKAHIAMSAEHALAWLAGLETRPCIDIDRDLFKVAAGVAVRYQISYWDGAIIAAAEALGAGTVYSEDLGHGQHYGDVVVVNPFAATA